MPLVSLGELADLLACPREGRPLLAGEGTSTCPACGTSYPWVAGRWPVLVDAETSVLDVDATLASGAASVVARPRGVLSEPLRRLTHGYNAAAERILGRMADEIVGAGGRRPRVLVIGGGTVGNGIDALYLDPRIDVLAFDIYASDTVQLVADAHRIPLGSGSVDAVVVQAVLEHVLEPPRVVAEIHRVLAPGGLVYADTPFMQQVHEGPWDFTRFTESGHRYLFRDFDEIDRGSTAGLGTSLKWSLDYFFRGLFRTSLAGRIVRLLFFWLTWMDGLLGAPETIDGASGLFFYGRRSDVSLSPKDVRCTYRGAQR